MITIQHFSSQKTKKCQIRIILQELYSKIIFFVILKKKICNHSTIKYSIFFSKIEKKMDRRKKEETLQFCISKVFTLLLTEKLDIRSMHMLQNCNRSLI